MSESLVMNFLGPPEVLYGEQRVKFATNKALALLAYLVIETGTQPRQKLQAIFWPESETHLAQAALRNTLVRLKEGLRGVAEPLRIEGDQIGFNPSCDYKLDLDLVTRAASDSHPSQLSEVALPLLQVATTAMRGPFLEAFSLPDAPAFDDWVMEQRTIFGQRLNLIFDRLSQHQLKTHAILPAIVTVHRWLVLDRLNETAYCRLMRLHFLNGDRSAALQTFETCRRLLAEELGSEPSPETEEVIAHIRSVPPPVITFSRPPEGKILLHIPFAGRSKEFGTLVNVFHQARDGIPQVAVVSGEAGIGKTRLAEEFLNWAGLEKADILCGSAYQTGRRLSYQPIIDALRVRLDFENAPEDLLDDAWLVELSTILPELRERYPDLAVAACDETSARSRLFEAIARLGQSLSARGALVLYLDDFQWADIDTLELLHYLLRTWRTSHSPILVLILTRSEALSTGPGLGDWIVDLRRDVPVTRLELTSLEVSDMVQLFQSLAGDNPAEVADLATWLQAETDGQPLVVVENLTAFEKSGTLVWKDGILDCAATLGKVKSRLPTGSWRDWEISERI